MRPDVGAAIRVTSRWRARGRALGYAAAAQPRRPASPASRRAAGGNALWRRRAAACRDRALRSRRGAASRCRPTWPSSRWHRQRRASRACRCASRSVRAPARGRSASAPPRSRDEGTRDPIRRRGSGSSGRVAPPPSPSTRCASRGGPGPKGPPRQCPRLPSLLSRARSRLGLLCATCRRGLRPRPDSCRRACDETASRKRRLSERGSTRRLPLHRLPRARSEPRSGRRLRPSSS